MGVHPVSSQVSSPKDPGIGASFLGIAGEADELDGSIRPTSSKPVVPSFSTADEGISETSATLQVFDLDQSLSDNFENFLGPESMWLDFLSVPEPPNGFNWAEGNLLVGTL